MMGSAHSRERLLHHPYGDHHPYTQSPVERFPRDPIMGEAVTLGVATAPEVEAVWATWSVDGSGEKEAAGEATGTGDGQRIWQVRLPSFSAGARVSYRLHGQQGQERLSSDAFSFVVAGWQAVVRAGEARFGEDRVQLNLTLEGSEASATLTLLFHERGLLQMHWAVAAEERSVPSPAADRATYTVLEDSDARLRLATPALEIRVEREPCRLAICTATGVPLLEESRPLAWLLGEGSRALQISQSFASPAGEAFYGFGERFNALDQRGEKLDVRVYEQYRAQGTRTYIPVPFFLSSRGYGLYLDSSRHVDYDLAGAGETWSYRAEIGESGTLSCYLIARDEPWQIVSAFTELTGKPALPPAWVFGPWMSSNDWNSQARVMDEVRQTQEHEIAATVLVIEAWSDEVTFYIWNDARYEARPGGEAFGYDDFTFPADGLWPDPKGMVQALHDKGIRLLLWQIPVIKQLGEPHLQQDNDREYMVAKDYCVREANGEPYRIRPLWFHDGLVWDVTNRAGVDWWLRKRAYLLDELGVDGFKTDGGEHIWGRDLRFSDGRRGDELWNLYPNLYVGVYHQFARERRAGDAVTFSRAGFTGAQAFPGHWAGDETSTWEAFRASILAGLNAGISGIPFWGWDIAGFSGEIPSAELYLRATAMATFCPIMQYHSEYNARRTPSRDRTPWNIQARTGDDAVIPLFRDYANLRMNLLPYITSEAWQASKTGIPLMRALALAFPDDKSARDYPYQYLFGSALLVAPVVEPEQRTWSVYLPAGSWTDFWTGMRYEGPQRLDVPVPPERIPVFARAGSVLALNLDASRTLPGAVGNRVDRYEQLCFRLYPGGAGAMEWYDHLSRRVFRIAIMGAMPEGLRVDVPALPYRLTLMVPARPAGPVTLDGVPLPQSESGEPWQQAYKENWYENAGAGEIWVSLEPSEKPRMLGFAGAVAGS